ncbi:hypothetical protein [Candidatus Pantoea multigeneris]|uniref:SMI1/KNR4 family protein n=1 Tax=Candidatus Pantoea multigeneris TaxID=2608357 RepID=A0ABX0R9R1_9GAMM|nr:hypothetical protein [Pantoea multigeneris]NIF22096.1 hypothetical protein [Pantoea multigeneris]
MLSKKLIDNLKEKGWWFEDAAHDYANEIIKLGIQPASMIYDFYTHAEDGPTFNSQGKEIYQLGWFLLNANYEFDLKRTHKLLMLPDEFIPLDSFEGGHGLFYNRANGAVIGLSPGKDINDFKNGKLQYQWNDFNAFLEWYFNL